MLYFPNFSFGSSFCPWISYIISISLSILSKTFPELSSKPSLSSKIIPSCKLFYWVIFQHALLRITIATNVVQLVLTQVLHIVYSGIFIIKKFIPTQESIENIVVTQVMIIMHSASIMIVWDIVKFRSGHSDLNFIHQFQQNLQFHRNHQFHQ